MGYPYHVKTDAASSPLPVGGAGVARLKVISHRSLTLTFGHCGAAEWLWATVAGT